MTTRQIRGLRAFMTAMAGAADGEFDFAADR